MTHDNPYQKALDALMNIDFCREQETLNTLSDNYRTIREALSQAAPVGDVDLLDVINNFARAFENIGSGKEPETVAFERLLQAERTLHANLPKLRAYLQQGKAQ